MKISNEERREVAAKLRSLDESIDGVPLMCTKQEHNAMALRAIRAVVGKGDVFHLLADLIDRPTCHDVLGEKAHSDDFECSECGFSINTWDMDGAWLTIYYCPCCGAEVVSDED